MGPDKGMYIRDINSEPYGVNTISAETLDGYDYIVIQVVYWVELPEQKRLCPIFLKYGSQ